MMAKAATEPLHCNLAVPDNRLDPQSNEDSEKSIHNSQNCSRVGRALRPKQLISAPARNGAEYLCLLCLLAVLLSVLLSLAAKGFRPSNVTYCVDNAVTGYPRFPNVGAPKEIERHLLVLRIAPILLKTLNGHGRQFKRFLLSGVIVVS
jgi:hypothetical protein